MKSGVERCNDFVEAVLSGKLAAPETVKQACARYRADFDNPKFIFDEFAADAAVHNIERFKHPKGRWQGKPVVLENWQCFVVCNLFGWKRRATKLRRFRRGYLRVPRKNGKTMLAILIALVMFGPDMEPGAEVYLGATGQDQADELLFYPAKFIVEQSPEYKKHFGVEVRAKSLVIPANFSKFRSVIRKPPDGSNPHCAIVDEYHLHDDSSQVDTFDTGMGAREEPLMLITTTAGSNLSGPCKEYDDDCLDLLEGKFEHDSRFVMIYALDKDDSWEDLESWLKVNPNAGLTVDVEFLQDQLAEARRNPSKQNELRTKHANEWVGAATTWLNILLWQRQSKPSLFEKFRDCPCYGGVDLATRNDANAVSLIFKNEDGEYFQYIRLYVPEGAVRKNPKYKTFVNSGEMIVTPGEATDQARIEEDILAMQEEFDVRGWGFDPYQGAYIMRRCYEQGLEVVEYGNTVKNISPPMKEVEALVEEGTFYNDGNAAMTWMVGNVVCFVDVKDNIFPRKQNRHDKKSKIDGPVSMFMGVGMWLADEGDDEIGMTYV